MDLETKNEMNGTSYENMRQLLVSISDSRVQEISYLMTELDELRRTIKALDSECYVGESINLKLNLAYN